MAKKTIGILISGSGTNMQAIVHACKTGNVNADVAFVGADNLDASGLVWARDRLIPVFIEDYKQRKLLIKHRRIHETWFPSDSLVQSIHKKSAI